MNDEINLIGNEKRYEIVTKNMEYCNEKIIQFFNLFLKFFASIVGGVLWLKTQENVGVIADNINDILPFIFTLIGISSLVLIWKYWFTWLGYRKTESQLVGSTKLPMPKYPKSFISELIMSSLIIITTVFSLIIF